MRQEYCNCKLSSCLLVMEGCRGKVCPNIGHILLYLNKKQNIVVPSRKGAIYGLILKLIKILMGECAVHVSVLCISGHSLHTV